MACLYVFNPENDLALACGEPNFTPPAMARQIKRDLQLIQLWIGDEGYIYAPVNDINTCFVDRMKSCFPKSCGNQNLYVDGTNIDCISPWGWSSAIASELSKRFKDYINIDVSKIRELSHRKTSISISSYLLHYFPEIGNFSMPELCNTENDVTAMLKKYGECMVKAPWSGSGKGVFRINKVNYSNYLNWIRSTIRKQGSVICEQYLDKQQDFALEFYSDGKSIKYIGPSVFFNNSRFSYERALVASSDLLEKHLFNFMPRSYFERLKNAMVYVLDKIVPQIYTGYLGVDMMIYKEDGNYRIMPCVELNLRMTMGLIANRVGTNVLEKGKVADMSIIWHKDTKSAMEYIGSQKMPVIKDGMLESGTLLLSPLYPDSRYTAVVTVRDKD